MNKTYPIVAEFTENINFNEPKKILVAGAGSYIGESFRTYLSAYENYLVDSFDTMTDEWKKLDFSAYDVVYDVAGIAHIKETKDNKDLYYAINRDLAYEIAKKAKAEGVGQFVYLSSMSVYGLTTGRIDFATEVNPVSAYGKSKLEAERLLWQLNDNDFVVSIVRPPMVYGNGCKGNYQALRKLALKLGFFPEYSNERSMIYIDNLSSAVRGIIHNNKAGLYFPQNIGFVNTHGMVKEIAANNSEQLCSTTLFNEVIKFAESRLTVFKKVFGTLTYAQSMNVPEAWIAVKSFEESMKLTEAKR